MIVLNILGWGFLVSSWMCTFWWASTPYKNIEHLQRIRLAAMIFAACSVTVFITALLTSGTVNK